jgi:glutamate--cysteine ligase
VASGIDIRDIKFARLLIVWLASAPMNPLDRKGQIQAVQNFKNGAHFDLETVNIVTPSGKSFSGKEAALSIISDMKSFYREFSREEMDIIEFEEQKLLDIRKSYAWQIREIYGSDYVKKGLELVKSEEICNNKW